MGSRPTALVALARTLVDACRAEGIDVDRLLAKANIAHELLSDLDGRVETARLLQLWALAAEHSADPFFGLHVGERFVGAKTISVVGYAARNSHTLGDCYEQTVRFARLTNEGSDIRLDRNDGTLSIGGLPGEPAWPRCYSEMALAAYLSVGRSWTATYLAPKLVRFAFPEPRDSSEYHRIFDARLEFDAPINALVFGPEALDLPLREADPELRKYLEEHAAALIAALPSDSSLATRVSKAIAALLGRDTPTVERVAQSLALSSRTLQRRLSEEGTSFAALLDQVRRSAALTLIEDRTNGLAEIASGVGYRDLESFRAAFVRWTGKNPSEYRKQATDRPTDR